MKQKISSEKELAAILVGWLQAQEWEVYQEVQCDVAGGGVCDIVAVRHGIIWAIECKMTLSLGLIGQAYRWKSYANYVSVCIPEAKGSRCRFTTKVMADYEIGSLVVNQEDRYWTDRITVFNRSLNRHISQSLKESLRDEQKTWAMAGNADGKKFTPFQNTKSQIQSYVKRRGSVLFKDLINDIEHHYSSDVSAKVSLKHWIEKGVIYGIRLRKEGKKLFVEIQEEEGVDA